MLDRSRKGMALTRRNAAPRISAGLLATRCGGVEDFTLRPGAQPFDLAFALRVGTLDGRHPGCQARAPEHIVRALVPGAPLLVDGGDPLRELSPAAVRGGNRAAGRSFAVLPARHRHGFVPTLAAEGRAKGA